MQLTWIPARRRFVGTQAEAKAEKTAFEVVDVPVVKADLIQYLNDAEARHEQEMQALRDEIAALTPSDAAVLPEDETDIAPPAPAAAKPITGDLVEQVMDLDQRTLVRVLGAAIGRLGEIAGIHGWAAFAKDIYAWSPASRNVEQGLGMLMLAAFDSFGMKGDGAARPKGRSILTADETGEE